MQGHWFQLFPPFSDGENDHNIDQTSSPLSLLKPSTSLLYIKLICNILEAMMDGSEKLLSAASFKFGFKLYLITMVLILYLATQEQLTFLSPQSLAVSFALSLIRCFL
jgi:hypothetical protein